MLLKLVKRFLPMKSFLIFGPFLVVWFLVLPRIPGISRFT